VQLVLLGQELTAWQFPSIDSNEPRKASKDQKINVKVQTHLYYLIIPEAFGDARLWQLVNA